jgi:starch-binding outer membrane protein, SusD/RagB family
LPTPPNKAAALQVLFREKAFWTFGRGQRLPDLRRLIRQYNLLETSVFPTGVYFKGGVYGHDVNMQVPTSELSNPNFTGCMDRNA